MASAPIIDSPCPFRVSAMPDAGRDHCGHCDRQVHNLDGMSSSQRKAFMASCEGKVCVAYTVHRSAQRRNVSLGAGLLASLAGSAALAQDAPNATPAPSTPIDRIDVRMVESTTILTPEQIAAIPIPGREITLADGTTYTAASVVFLGSVLDAKGARWADESALDAHDTADLPEIGADDWLPTPKAP